MDKRIREALGMLMADRKEELEEDLANMPDPTSEKEVEEMREARRYMFRYIEVMDNGMQALVEDEAREQHMTIPTPKGEA